jgi:hypothetical protein
VVKDAVKVHPCLRRIPLEVLFAIGGKNLSSFLSVDGTGESQLEVAVGLAGLANIPLDANDALALVIVHCPVLLVGLNDFAGARPVGGLGQRATDGLDGGARRGLDFGVVGIRHLAQRWQRRDADLAQPPRRRPADRPVPVPELNDKPVHLDARRTVAARPGVVSQAAECQNESDADEPQRMWAVHHDRSFCKPLSRQVSDEHLIKMYRAAIIKQVLERTADAPSTHQRPSPWPGSTHSRTGRSF